MTQEEPIIPAFDAKNFLKTLTHRPGIYKMLNDEGEIIYIGKAKNLKNRVSSYFRTQNASPKQQAMVAKIAAIEVTITHTETEALLLESQQIKRYKPRYNITLRDDKSYPYVFISTFHEFPQITFHRGAKSKRGRYFGPYPSAPAVKETLKLLQKIFPIRQCEDSYYNARSRPCLQHQIGRCTAPCVGLVSHEHYQEDLNNTILFLEGQGGLLIDQLVGKMETASAKLDFEQAAVYRDQIIRLRSVLEKNFVHGEKGDVDLLACAKKHGIACVQVFFIRHGQQLGNRAFYPKISEDDDEASILQAFIAQYYLDKPVPHELLVSHALPEKELLVEYLTQQAKRQVAIAHAVRSERYKWLQMAVTNAENALNAKLGEAQSLQARFENLQQILKLNTTPKRLECFDISHTQGEQTVASCVVFDSEGAVKSAYRRFNIEGITGGDDYAAIHQAVSRRFKRQKQGEHPAPDVLLIDGGQGQVKAAQKALAELEISHVMIVGIAKGPDRKAGMEQLLLVGQSKALDVPPGSSALLLIQQIRDEAHRFAITGHRLRRGKATQKSVLSEIAGLGPKRRQLLLTQFGGAQGVSSASVDALATVNGISRQLAQRIYDTFHSQDDP